MIINDGNDLLALLVFVPREANAIAPFLATVLVPSPWSTLRSSCFSTARCRTLATNACQSDPSSAHLALDRPRARSIAGLFSRPSSEPRMSVSVSRGSPVTCLRLQTVAALRISRTSPSRPRGHLPPFALCSGVTASVVGRDSHDSYGGSVAVGSRP